MTSGKWNFVVGAAFMALAGLWAFTTILVIAGGTGLKAFTLK